MNYHVISQQTVQCSTALFFFIESSFRIFFVIVVFSLIPVNSFQRKKKKKSPKGFCEIKLLHFPESVTSLGAPVPHRSRYNTPARRCWLHPSAAALFLLLLPASGRPPTQQLAANNERRCCLKRFWTTVSLVGLLHNSPGCERNTLGVQKGIKCSRTLERRSCSGCFFEMSRTKFIEI